MTTQRRRVITKTNPAANRQTLVTPISQTPPPPVDLNDGVIVDSDDEVIQYEDMETAETDSDVFPDKVPGVLDDDGPEDEQVAVQPVSDAIPFDMQPPPDAYVLEAGESVKRSWFLVDPTNDQNVAPKQQIVRKVFPVGCLSPSFILVASQHEQMSLDAAREIRG